MLTTTIAFFLFTLEWFHVWGHSAILFRIRLLPRKDLLRIRGYFLVEGLTVVCSSFLYTGMLHWLAFIHFLQHLYHFAYWDQTYFSKRIISWSSLDWLQSDFRERWQLDSILGTVFDLVVHVCMMYYLGAYLSSVQAVAALVLVHAGLAGILFGPYFALASPDKIPAWIQKRIQPEKLKALSS